DGHGGADHAAVLSAAAARRARRKASAGAAAAGGAGAGRAAGTVGAMDEALAATAAFRGTFAAADWDSVGAFRFSRGGRALRYRICRGAGGATAAGGGNAL